MNNLFENYLRERNINFLFHFTRLSNLDSILKSGLMTKQQCHRTGVKPDINDEHRYDETDAICASISFPNYKMLYQLRCNNPKIEWSIIKIPSSLLWRKRCAFSKTNAAHKSIKNIPLTNRFSLTALQSMFDNEIDSEVRHRDNLEIPPHYTTDPQAEVLIFECVPPTEISCIYLQKSATLQDFSQRHKGQKFQLNGGFFTGRCDFKHWQ